MTNKRYRVALAVDGMIYPIVEATSEEEAEQKARELYPALDWFEVYNVTELTEDTDGAE
jgi:hypothetical protein